MPSGEIDALDQIEDTPAEDGKVYIYEQFGSVGTAHVYYGGGRGGWYPIASYKYRPDVDGEKLRENSVWQAWAQKQER